MTSRLSQPVLTFDLFCCYSPIEPWIGREHEIGKRSGKKEEITSIKPQP
jgi:hypothetical protein